MKKLLIILSASTILMLSLNINAKNKQLNVVQKLLIAYNHGDISGMKKTLTSTVDFIEVPTEFHSTTRATMLKHWEKWLKEMPNFKGKYLYGFRSGNNMAAITYWHGKKDDKLITVKGQTYGKNDKKPAAFKLAFIIKLNHGLISSIHAFFSPQSLK